MEIQMNVFHRSIGRLFTREKFTLILFAGLSICLRLISTFSLCNLYLMKHERSIDRISEISVAFVCCCDNENRKQSFFVPCPIERHALVTVRNELTRFLQTCYNCIPIYTIQLVELQTNKRIKICIYESFMPDSFHENVRD